MTSLDFVNALRYVELVLGQDFPKSAENREANVIAALARLGRVTKSDEERDLLRDTFSALADGLMAERRHAAG